MQISIEKIVLLAKQRHIDELRRLADVTQLVEAVGKLIHKLQAERGASSIYLASKGASFADTRLNLASESQMVEQEFRAILATQLEGECSGPSKLTYLMAWVLIGLDELSPLRGRISKHALAPNDCIVAFSRLIASLISLIFEMADSAVDPRISNLLVALFNLVQGKEFAGQERAVGALSFSSGACDAANKNRLVYLIDTQERHFQIFAEFSEGPLLEKWQEIMGSPNTAKLERMRRVLCSTRDGLDGKLSNTWFEVCSERLSAIWSLEGDVVHRLKAQCAALIADAQLSLQDSQGLLKVLCASPPAKAQLASRIFDSAIPVENVLRFEFQAGSEILQGQPVVDVFQEQAQRLLSMEAELATARRALEERKTVERAKGVLMARFSLSEDDAYKRMRSASMEQNKRLTEVAEAVLTLINLS